MSTDRLEVVDTQVHIWAPPSAEYPWSAGRLADLPPELATEYRVQPHPGEELVGDLHASGVDSALITSPWLYGADHSYAFAQAERLPGRFGVVGPVAPDDADPVLTIETYLERPYAVGVRFVLFPRYGELLGSQFAPLLEAAARGGVPVFISPMARFDEIAAVARRHPGLTVVLDHLGLWLPADRATRVALLPRVLALSAYDNILLKCTALPELSSETYPFSDLWSLLEPVLEAYSVDRLMWGTDINQHRHHVTYEQALGYLRDSDRLSVDEKRALLGGTARRTLRWPTPTDALTMKENAHVGT